MTAARTATDVAKTKFVFDEENNPLHKQLVDSAARRQCERSHLFFTRYFFKLRHALSFRVNWHHELICNAVQDVIDGKVKNLIINVPPGSSKTELVAINLIARGLAINPRARFLHLSYSNDLAGENSLAAKDLVNSEEYQAFWPLKIRDDSRSKQRWNVEVDGKKAGGVYATGLGGQITGFRAGHMAPGFQGAIIIDDPLKVEDAYSKTARNNANRKLVSTVKSRKANPDTPIVIIMQRLSDEDPTGYIEKGNMPGDWTYVKIPALMDEDDVKRLGINERKLTAPLVTEPKDDKGRFSYWPYKEPLHDMIALEDTNSFVFNGQYQQRPSALGGSLISGDWFERITVLPKIQFRIITGDTAQKTAERNDFTCLQHWGLSVTGQAILLGMLHGKFTAPQLRTKARDFWNECAKWNDDAFNVGRLRKMYIEDKTSGTGLIQELASPTPEDLKKGVVRIPVEGIERNRDKLTEWMDAIPHMKAGSVALYTPEGCPWVGPFIVECEGVTAEMTHSHDDQVDPLCDAVDLLVAKKNKLSGWQALANSM